MTREELYKLTYILDAEVLCNFMHGGEAAEVIAMFEESVEKSGTLNEEETTSEALYLNEDGKPSPPEETEFSRGFAKGAEWQREHVWHDPDEVPELECKIIFEDENFLCKRLTKDWVPKVDVFGRKERWCYFGDIAPRNKRKDN